MLSKQEIKDRVKDYVKTLLAESKIEMLDLRSSISLAPTHGTNPCVGLAKLLQGIEKSYDPGKKVLEESQKNYQGFRSQQGKTKIQLKNRKRGRGL